MSHTAPPIDYVNSLALPEPDPQYEGLEAASVFTTTEDQAVAVGAQMAEFSEGVPPALRASVANCLLLAQLAANKAAAASTDLMAWYGKYVETLQNTGWLVQTMDLQNKDVADKDLDVNEAIIPVLTAMLGPEVAALSMVIAVLNGLKSMDKDSSWIKLFDRASQHASGAKLQFGFVQMDPNDTALVQVKLLAVAIDAKSTITQVLFFKFSDTSAKLKTADSQLGIEIARLQGLGPAISARVQPFLINNISEIDLPEPDAVDEPAPAAAPAAAG